MRCLPMPTNPSSQPIQYPCPNADMLAPNSCGWWWLGPLAGVVLVSTIIRRPSQHLVDLPTLFCPGFAESIPVVHRCVKYDLSCLMICWGHWWVRGWLKRAPFRRKYPLSPFWWRKVAKDRKVSRCFWGTPETSYFDPLLVQVQQRAGRRIESNESRLPT